MVPGTLSQGERPAAVIEAAKAAPIFDRVALIGLGLIASSMFWATRRAGAAEHVTGYARSHATRETARAIATGMTIMSAVAESEITSP